MAVLHTDSHTACESTEGVASRCEWVGRRWHASDTPRTGDKGQLPLAIAAGGEAEHTVELHPAILGPRYPRRLPRAVGK